MSIGFQVKNTCEIISGGYEKEYHGANTGYTDWTTVPDEGEVVSTYYYHDSAINYGENNNSSRVLVTITDKWKYIETLPDNSIKIQITTTLNSIKRTHYSGNPGHHQFVIRAKHLKTDSGWKVGPYYTWVDEYYTIHNDPVDMGSHEFIIPPDGGISDSGTIYYRNNTYGHDGDTPPSIYIDEFWMGLRIKNPLPAKLDPPVVTKIEQTPDICHRTVDSTFTITMTNLPDSNSHTIEMYIGQDSAYRDAVRYTATSSTKTFSITVDDMKPATKYYYKVRLVPDNYVSDWREGTLTTIAVIPPAEVVPEFSVEDCEKLTAGNGLVNEWPNW